MIETRNDSGQMLQQQLWGRQYIDELIMVSLNMDPQNATSGTATENLAERHFWAVTDANFNVMGLVSEWGKLHERYEYDPYGGRTVYSHGYLLADLDGSGVIDAVDYNMMDFDNADPSTPAWSRADLDGDGDVDDDDLDILDAAYLAGQSLPQNDPLVTTSTSDGKSFRGPLVGGATSTIGINPFGHQGLMHDEETSTLIYNRERYLDTELGRFVSADPLGYVDGMSVYEYVGSLPVSWLDPFGLSKTKGIQRGLNFYYKLQRLVTKCGREGMVQVHHIITQSTFKRHEELLRKLGFEVHGPENLIMLPTRKGRRALQKEGNAIGNRAIHDGWSKAHREYNQRYGKEVDGIIDEYTNGDITADEAKAAISGLQSRLYQELANDQIILSGPWVDSKHLMTAIGPFIVVVAGTNAYGEVCPDREMLSLQMSALSESFVTTNDYLIELGKEIGTGAFEISPLGDIYTIGTGAPTIIGDIGQIWSVVHDQVIEWRDSANKAREDQWDRLSDHTQWGRK